MAALFSADVLTATAGEPLGRDSGHAVSVLAPDQRLYTIGGLEWTGILVFSRYALAVQSRVRYREATDVLSR